MVGQSAGGWGTLAYDSRGHGRVAALVAMAPGRGGHQANGNCAPEALVAAAGRYGRTARTPVLWIDGTADSYFGPDLSRAMADRFAAASGRVTFAQPVGADHDLFFDAGGSSVWGPLVENYLAGRGVRP